MGDWLLSIRTDLAALRRSVAPQARDAALPVLGESATAWAIATAERVHGELVVADDAADFVVAGRERAALEASILAMLTGVVSERSFEPPAEALAQVRWAARQGTALDVLLREVWRSHSLVQAHLIEAMTAEVAQDLLAAQIKRVSGGLLTFVGGLIDALSRVFEQESAAWGLHRSATIRRVVDEIVEHGDARSAAPDTADQVLGIRLSWCHLAAVLWPMDTSQPLGWSSDSARWTEAVKDQLNLTATLVLARTDGSTDVIWSGSGGPGPDALGSLPSLALPAGFGAAFGFSARGTSGFRRSLLAARELARAARHAARPRAWTTDQHGALALMMQDRDSAARFVRHVLAGLEGDTEKDRVLRTTLLAFLEHQGSRAAAAAQLHIAATTVAYRVQQAEARLEQPLAHRRSAVVAALSLATNFPHLLTD